MVTNFENNLLTVNGKDLELDGSINKLANLSLNQFKEFFENRERKIPRAINMYAIRAAVNSQVECSKEIELTDEQRYRLLFYPYFCETQLQNFATVVANDQIYRTYLNALWKLILLNSESINLIDGEVNYLLALPYEESDTNFDKFQNETVSAFADEPGNFDGLTKDDFRSVCSKSSTLNELREMGTKFGLNIPRRLKKEELQAIIIEDLISLGKYDDETAKSLDIMSVLTMQRFAKKNDIKISIELKKEELIEYVLRQADKASLPKLPRGLEIVNLPEVAEWEFKTDYVENVIEEETQISCSTNALSPDELNMSDSEKESAFEEITPEPLFAEPVQEATFAEPVVADADSVDEEPITAEVEEEIIKKPVSEKVVYVSQGGIDAATLKSIIKETVSEIVASTSQTQAQSKGLSAEEVRQIVRESSQYTQVQTQQGMSPDDLRYLVEGTVRTIVTQIVDKIPTSQGNQQAYIQQGEVRNEQYQSAPSNDYSNFELSTMISNSTNRLYDGGLASSINSSTASALYSSGSKENAKNDIPEVSQNVNEPTKKEKALAAKARYKEKIARQKEAERLHKKQTNVKVLLRESGSLKDDELKYVKDQTAILEYKAAQARVKTFNKQHRNGIFLKIILGILLLVLIYLGIVVFDVFNPNIGFTRQICAWSETNINFIYSQFHSFGNWIKGLTS